MRTHTLLLALLTVLVAPLQAQVSVELRGGVAIGNHAPAAAGLETAPGPSLSAALEYRFTPLVSGYATYTRGSFGCDHGFCVGQSVTMTSSGFGAGARFHRGRLPWVRAGLLLHGTTVKTSGGTSSVSPSLGYELGTGISVPLADRLQLVSGIGYRSHADAAERTSVLSFEIGGRFRVTGVE